MAVKPIPEGFHTVTPYLFVSGAAKLIDFMKQAFGAKEVDRMTTPDGAIMHAQVKIGDSIIMLGDARDQWAPMPTSLYLYVNDTDAVYKRAIQAGGTSVREPTDEFYGDRSAGVKDPTGNMWWLATHIEDVAPDELRRRAEAVMQKRKGGGA